MAIIDTFDKVGSCLSKEKTHHKNDRLLTQLPQRSQPQEKPEGGENIKSRMTKSSKKLSSLISVGSLKSIAFAQIYCMSLA